MTSRERVVKTLNHQQADRLPVDYVFQDYRTLVHFSEYYGMSSDEFLDYLGCDIVYLQVMDEIQKFISNPEMLKFTFENEFARRDEKDHFVSYDRWGVGWHMESDGERPVTEYVIENAEDILTYQAPDPLKPGQFHDIEKNIKKYNDKNYAVAVAQYYGLFEKGWLIRGYENFMLDCYENADKIELLLDKILDYRLKISEEIVKYDVAFGHSGDDYGTQNGPMMSLEMWRKLFKPRLAKIWDVYKKKGLPVVHHSCGDCTLYLDDMIEIGLDAIHPVQSSCMDIEYLGKRYGGNLVFYGGIDCQKILTYGTPDDVKKNVENVVRHLGKHKGLILSPINIMRNVSMENFDALVGSIKKYREM